MRKKRKLRAQAEALAESLEVVLDGPAEDQSEAADQPELAQAEEGGEEKADADGEEREEHAEDQAEEHADPDAHLEEVQAMSPARLKVILESLLFASDKPLAMAQLKQLTGVRNSAAIQAGLDALVEDYRDRGIVVHEVAGGYQFRTHPSSSDHVQRLIAGRPVRLSRAQLETLAIIAYRQPVTRPEIDEIRGVDCGSTLKVLLDRDLIRVLGKKEEPGRPLLYGTTREFLAFFSLKDLRELPTLREFHELSEESLREVEKLDGEQAPPETPETVDAPGADGDREPAEAA
jgi:segregation and condensation protein B